MATRGKTGTILEGDDSGTAPAGTGTVVDGTSGSQSYAPPPPPAMAGAGIFPPGGRPAMGGAAHRGPQGAAVAGPAPASARRDATIVDDFGTGEPYRDQHVSAGTALKGVAGSPGGYGGGRGAAGTVVEGVTDGAAMVPDGGVARSGFPAPAGSPPMGRRSAEVSSPPKGVQPTRRIAGWLISEDRFHCHTLRSGSNRVGRDFTNEVVIEDPSVSSLACNFVCEVEGALLMPRPEAANPSTINGKRIYATTEVPPYATVGFGSTRWTFVSADLPSGEGQGPT
mgnify:CR=1 FL=1